MSYVNSAENLDVAAQFFSKEAFQVFQSSQRLQGTCMEMTGTVGTTQNIPYFDKIEMQPTGFSPTDLPVSDIGTTNVQVVQNAYVVKTVLGVGERTLFAFDFLKALAEAHGLAEARQTDSILIDAIFEDPDIDPETDYYNVPIDTGSTNGMVQEKLTNAVQTLGYNNGVDFMPGDGSLWLPKLNYISYFQDPTVTNWFFSNQRPLQEGKLSSYLGIDHRGMAGPGAGKNFIPFEVDGDNTNFTAPLVHRKSLQRCYNVSPQTQITYVPQQLRWEIVSYIVAGSKVTQTAGIAIINAQTPTPTSLIEREVMKKKLAEQKSAKKLLTAFEREMKASGVKLRGSDKKKYDELVVQMRKTYRTNTTKVKSSIYDTITGKGYDAITTVEKVADNVDPTTFKFPGA